MQTNFTAAQLADPATAVAHRQLRACVHCGFCTATCPTYQVLHDEADSPRGRIYMIKQMLESGQAPDAQTVTHIDRCLSCFACMTTCPSGVHYRHLIDHARAYVARHYRRRWDDRALRWALARILPYPMRMRLAMAAANLARPFARLIPDARLRAMLALAPRRLPPVSRNDDPQTFAVPKAKMRVALMTGCAQRALNTDINDAAIRLLTRLGAEVVILPQGCCGALTQHMGHEDQARAAAARNISAFTEEHAARPLDAIVITTSGCGTTVKEYDHLFAHTPLALQAKTVATLARDITEVVAELGLPPDIPQSNLRVAYHAACSLQHGQRITNLPKDLLSKAGFTVLTPADSHLCCGSAGTYNLLQPALAGELGARKRATLTALTPDVIAAGNLGCMMQIGQGMNLPVVHTVELLDWATGGPRPSAMTGEPNTPAVPRLR